MSPTRADTGYSIKIWFFPAISTRHIVQPTQCCSLDDLLATLDHTVGCFISIFFATSMLLWYSIPFAKLYGGTFPISFRMSIPGFAGNRTNNHFWVRRIDARILVPIVFRVQFKHIIYLFFRSFRHARIFQNVHVCLNIFKAQVQAEDYETLFHINSYLSSFPPSWDVHSPSFCIPRAVAPFFLQQLLTQVFSFAQQLCKGHCRWTMDPFLVLTSIWCVRARTCSKHIKCVFAARARRCRQGRAGDYSLSFVFTPLFWCQLLTKATGKWSRTLLCVTRLPLSWIVSFCCICGVQVHQLKTIGSRVTALFHSLSLLPSYQLGWSAHQICS